MVNLALASLLAGVSAAQAPEEVIKDIGQLVQELFDVPEDELAERIKRILEEEDRLKLFNACRSMFFHVDDLSDEAARAGLSAEALEAAGESRLRAARLWPQTGAPDSAVQALTSQLVASVHVVSPAFHISLTYSKPVTDEFGVSGFAITWVRGATGTGRGDLIVSGLSQLLDRFLAEYLRINAEACAGLPNPADSGDSHR